MIKDVPKAWESTVVYPTVPVLRTTNKFPTDKQKPRWLNLIKRQENKKPDMFKVTEYTKICEEHFEREDIKFKLNRKYLNPDAEPKHFDCWPKEFQLTEKS